MLRKSALIAAALLTAGVQSGMAQVSFEGLTPSTYLRGSYAGFDWSCAITTSCSGGWYTGDVRNFNSVLGYARAASTGTGFILNGGAADVALSAATRFTFNGAYFGVGHDQDLFLTLIGYRSGTEVFRSVLSLDAAQHSYQAVNFTDVDRVVFASRTEGGTARHFTMDDATFNQPVDATVTPEPLSMALMGTGLAGLAGAARRRRKRQQP
jgi:hypothetical protein